MAMVPHERSLVKKMEGKPFVLLGVDKDATKEAGKGAEKQHKITWRSWFDGNEGPIVKEWQIQGFPTLYLLDATGAIRNKWVGSPGGEVIDKAVEKLVKETEGKK
jgi:hypothetical protein